MIEIALSVYAAMLYDGMNFAQASYRDGEWRCILGYGGANVDGTRYEPELRSALRMTLLRPTGQWCGLYQETDCKTVLQKRTLLEAVAWIDAHRPNVRWIADRAETKANELGLLAPWVRALRTRRVVLVGPAYLSRVPKAFLDPRAHVIVRDDGAAWKDAEETTQTLIEILDPQDVVLFCAGMASNLIIHRLLPEVRRAVTLYDIGAILDPYAGRYSRSIYQTARWQETAPKNYP